MALWLSTLSTEGPGAVNPEFAGNASLRSFDSSDPLCPLQLDAHADWNADTGATSHMTPHRHWLRNYAPKRVAIKLADNNIVYSTGVGTGIQPCN